MGLNHTTSAAWPRDETWPAPTLATLPPPPAGRTGWPWTEETPPAAARPGGRPWPAITIVTPSFNQASFLEETIRSVLLQGYPNLEYMVLDGGSQDGSAAIIARYAPWLRYWRSRPDDGQSAAIHDGFARASGEILAWLNSDDCYRPGTLQRVAQYFSARPRLAFATGDVNFTDADSRIIKRSLAIRPVWRVTATLGHHSWPQQSSFWRHSAYRRAGGMDRNLRFCMDRDLFLRLAQTGPTGRIPGPALADFRQHEDAKTSRWQEIWRQERALLYERYGARFGRSPWHRLVLRTIWQIEWIKTRLRWRLVRRGIEV